MEKLVFAGFALVFLGVFLIVVGVLWSAFKGGREGSVEAGGVVFIGPIPIVFGSSERVAKYMLVLAFAVSLVLLLLYVLMWRGAKSLV